MAAFVSITAMLFPGLTVDLYRRKLHVSLVGLSVEQGQFLSNLDIHLSGNAVPTAQTDGLTAGAVVTSILTGIGDASGAEGLAAYLGIVAGALSPGGLAVATGAGLVGLYFSLIGNDTTKPPEYQLNLVGTAKGVTAGFIYQTNYLPDLAINLSGTFTPTVTQTAGGTEYQPIGFPQSYQRCDAVRLGAFGFRSQDGKSLDPRPRTIDFNWLLGSSEDTPNLRVEFDRPLGNLVSAPWANVAITDQTISLECVKYNAQLPNTLTKLVSFQPDGGSSYAVQNPADVISVCKQIQDGELIKVYFRWSATITAPDGGIPPFTAQYALQTYLPRLPMLINVIGYTDLLGVACELSNWKNTIGWNMSSPDNEHYRIDIDYSAEKVPVHFANLTTVSTAANGEFIHDTRVRGNPYPPNGGYAPNPNIHPKFEYRTYRVKLVQRSNSVVVSHLDTATCEFEFLECP